jgi:hypothetical protein
MICKNYLFTHFFFCAFFLPVPFICGAPVADKGPAWIADHGSVYPESEWVCVVESANEKEISYAKNSAAAQKVVASTEISGLMGDR